jgi:hypothetical protein
MTKPPDLRKRAFLFLEIGLILSLGWIVLSSNAVFRQDKSVQAGNAEHTTGQKKLRPRRVPAEGVPETRSVELLPQSGTALVCTSFDFAGGSAQGFTVLPMFGTPPALWHVANNTCRADLAGHSTPFDFYYGQEGFCNYNTGDRNGATLVSPSISLTGLVPPFELGFNYLLFVESGGSFDQTFVDLSTDGGATWTPVLSKGNLTNNNQWHNLVFDITAQVGAATSVMVRFRFDTVDNILNATTGWHIDDVMVCGVAVSALPACIQDDATHSVLRYNPTTGAYQFDNCHGVTLTGTGTVTVKGLTTTLQDNRADRRVLLKVDQSTMKATASVQILSPTAATFTITDRNIADNSCSCF